MEENKYKEALERAKLAIEECGNNLGRIKMIESIFPELKESEDEQHRKWILEYLYDGLRKSDEQFKDQFKSAIAWLEKQGEIDIEKPIIIGKRQLTGKAVELAKEVTPESLEEAKKKMLEETEPKFKAGDWLINRTNASIIQIVEANNNGYYHYIDQNGQQKTSYLGYIEWDYRPWSITDAKDGDVLTCCDNKPFIFKGFFDLNFPNCLAAYCGVTLENQFGHCNGKTFWTNQDVKPATKEQCNLLFQKMHEAGYEWDAEKKEMKLLISNGGDFEPELSHKEMTKKSEQVGWSEEDEDLLKWSLYNLEELQQRFSPAYGSVGKCIDWLKSIKDRVQPQPKQDGKWKWDEDDEKFVRENIFIGLGNIDGVSPELYSKIIDWLDLIKKRLS